MARAPNPGAPQRVSAHVVPKAPSFPADDEDEKTTIESGGWEEEASTTVEQGEAAERIRALALGAGAARSNTNITSTDGGGVNDEPTVDDQRALAAIALLPPSSVARLAITQGNDAGQVLEIRPGKTYTVGRGIDNDLVLSDITASRKHFDIRNEAGSWILADLGSGNGTLINQRIEDAPFLLASGDRIEVGNTAFRFDVVTTSVALPGLPPLGGARGAQLSGGGPPSDLDGEASDSREMPTPEVAAVPPPPREPPAATARDDIANGIPHEVPSPITTYEGSVDDDLELSTVSGQPMQAAEPPRPAMTVSRPKTLPPPAPLPPPRPRTQTGRPAMAFAGPRSQQMAALQPPPGMPPTAMAPTMSPMHAAPAQPPPATTLPLPAMANRGPLSPALLEPQLAAQPTTLPGQGPPLPARGPRLPFGYQTVDGAPQRISGPMRAVGPGLPGRDASTTALVHPMSYSGGQVAMAPPPPRRMVPALTRRMKLGAAGVGLVVFAAIATVAIIRSTSDDAPGATPQPPPVTASSETITPAPVVTPLPATSPAAAPPHPAEVAPTRPPAAATSATSPAAAPPRPAEIAPTRPPSPQSAPPVTTTPPPPAPPPAVVAAAPPPVRAAPAPSERAATRSEPPRPSKTAKRAEIRRPEHRQVEVAPPPPAARPKHNGRSMTDVKAEATGLYRSKNFSGAALAINSSLAGFGSDDMRDLKTIAGIYTQLGKAYAIGMAPGTKAIEAFQAVRGAINYDHEVGGAYQSELRERLALVAPKAANSYMAAKSYEQALQAVRAAEQVGSTSESLQVVRSSLEGTAHDLLSDARKEMATDPDGARQKARQVLGIVEPKSPLYTQAQKLINGP